MTVRVLGYRGDGTYYLSDLSHELDGLRTGPPGRTLGPPRPVPAVLGELLGGASGEGAVDVVLAAPKPVSVLLALEDEGAAGRLVALHDDAVDQVVAYLRAAVRLAPAAPAVAFTHGVNRTLDPHLHSHVLLGGATDREALAAHARAADALYVAALRDGLGGAVGRRAWSTSRDTTLVEGVDAGLVAMASVPRERDGRVERTADKPHPSREAVRRRWDELVADSVIGLVPTPPADTGCLDELRFARALGRGPVRHRDVVAAWATAATYGAPPAAVLEAADLAGRWQGRDGVAHAREVTDPQGVRALGPRPLAPGALRRWHDGRAALRRYLDDGHQLAHALDPTGAPARTLLALAALDAARGRSPGHVARALGDDAGRSLS